MSEITLITGGCRSGKSRYAQFLSEGVGEKRLFIATAPVQDDEMRRRVAGHRKHRGPSWETREEPYDVAGCLRGIDRTGRSDERSEDPSHQETAYDVVLCDCLTLWVNNLLYTASQNGVSLEEEEMAARTADLCAAARAFPSPVFFVTNEVGQGIVPADELSRRFRDLAGRCNQEMAAMADSVILMVSGLPLSLKGAKHENP
uniref:Bifunctional adenosylcobalamin biosynthesis protein n=1 Tax=Candidatus Kentrum sp. MB TaxID=2138164 RepID=A0A450XY33_9GAMM|nr:MAG: adenosylcobinamide kinase /adenosylcobinamide-phosphate guanylyltransferase [Candidatus Kentron sp. MB]VFK34165.1 MAG: adenosylcobinamide kinase /adenosylcobinamide-phosphate guanylyltransferase [Candidatus Kentron sp. MB]VFK76732.1 MAG: adenosylcobinamide kinase /adenosylcobinamide-phosphate guanylyltransferase [Candidatus Kentron sp. MB]